MDRQVISASVVVGNTTTNAISLNSRTVTGLIITGSVITGTSVTFLVSDDSVNYYPLYNEDSTEVSLTTGSVAKAYALSTNDFIPWKSMKIREGTSASAKAQATYNALIDVIVQPI